VKNAGGTYALVLRLDAETGIAVGRLGTFSFPPGCYLYSGSALGGLHARVRRHVEGGRRLHWHIDYLRQKADVVEVWYVLSGERLECGWHRAAASMAGAGVPVAGFGSSGCRCPAHLVRFPTMPSFETFREMVGARHEVKRVRAAGGWPG
jgi:Uri superfamily endonuclease